MFTKKGKAGVQNERNNMTEKTDIMVNIAPDEQIAIEKEYSGAGLTQQQLGLPTNEDSIRVVEEIDKQACKENYSSEYDACKDKQVHSMHPLHEQTRCTGNV